MNTNYIIFIIIIIVALYLVFNKRKGAINSNESKHIKGEEDDTFLLGDYQHYLRDLGQETIDDITGYPSESDFDKKTKLLKKATALKKDGDLKKSIKAIDKAILYCKCIDAIYKKAYYLQIDKQYDKAWKTMDSYRMEVSPIFVNSDNWGSSRRLLGLLMEIESGLIKLLKGEKKYKDLTYYLPGSIYLELVFYTIAQSNTQSFDDMFNRYTDTRISKKINKLYKEFDRSKYDESFRNFILLKKEDLEELFKASRMLEPGSDNYNEYAYIEKTENLNTQATKLMKDLYYGQLSINDECFKSSKK